MEVQTARSRTRCPAGGVIVKGSVRSSRREGRLGRRRTQNRRPGHITGASRHIPHGPSARSRQSVDATPYRSGIMTASQVDRSLLTPNDALVAAITKTRWDFAEAPRSSGVHSLHAYPAKFIAEVPRALIEHLSRPGDRIIDPFCGGGTTGVEAVAAGRSYVGLDANAFAVLLSQVKVEPLDDAGVEMLRNHIDVVSRSNIPDVPDAWRPAIPNIDKWSAPHVVADLAALRVLVTNIAIQGAQNVALLAFASTAARLSFQESETRYVSRPRPLTADAVKSSYLKDIVRMMAKAPRGPARPEVSVLSSGRSRCGKLQGA